MFGVVNASSTDTARAFWIAAPGHGEIRPETVHPPAPDEVLVRTRFSGISRGTEALVFHGRVPASEIGRMRAPFQDGDFPGPVKYGYANVGCVEQGPPELLGREVFSLYPHQTCFTVPAAAVYPLPDGVPARRAVLAANLETAINGLWDGHPQVGDRVTVVGAGTVGCLTARLATRIPGCTVELVDINSSRAAIARELGVRFALPDEATPDADLVLHTSGSATGLQLALTVAGFESTIVEMSWYGEGTIPVALGAAFHARRLTVRSSQVGHVASGQRARWDHARRLALALDLLRDDVLETLITGESIFDKLPEVLARLATTPGDTLCHCITYD
jgi:threonine dehydrogenase-like Zn-dependent dehydrogenase